jgi:hypothetical protein
MSLSPEEQILYDFAKASLPRWFTAHARVEEELGGFVKIFNRARAQVVFWASQMYIGNAVGPVSGEPDWLEQHARDRGTSRQDGETDVNLRLRLRNREDALTRSALLALINSMLDAAGITSNDYGLVELRRDRAFMLTRASATAAASPGDAFTKVGNVVTLTIAAAPWQAWMMGQTLTISGSTSAANDGDFVVTGFVGNVGVTYVNASGVAEDANSGTWEVNAAFDGFKAAYLSRGYRMAGPGATAGLIAILPFGTTEALRLAILEALRTRKAAGISLTVERRLSP